MRYWNSPVVELVEFRGRAVAAVTVVRWRMTLGGKYRLEVVVVDGRQRLPPEHEAGKLVGGRDVVVIDDVRKRAVVFAQRLCQKVKVVFTPWLRHRRKTTEVIALVHDKQQ